MNDSEKLESVLHKFVQFLRTLRLYKKLVFLCLIVALSLGGLYYTLTPRVFRSSAEILVLQSEPVISEATQTTISSADPMPGYINIICSEKVIGAAIAQLSEEHLVEFRDLPKHQWSNALRSGLSVSNPRRTNSLVLQYSSEVPETIVPILNAVVASYIEFMDSTHRDTSHDAIGVLMREKGELERRLEERRQALVELRARTETFSDGGKDSSDAVQAVLQLQDSLTTARDATLSARSLLQAVQTALRNGINPMEVGSDEMDAIARELFRGELGLDSNSAWSLSRLNEELVADEARLRNALSKYGQNHPHIQELQQRIRVKQQWIQNFHLVRRQQLQAIRQAEFAPKILEVAQQKLARAEAHEAAVREEFEREKAKALQINGQLTELDMLKHEIDRLRSYYDVLVQRIAEIDLTKEKGVRVALLGDPAQPRLPVWPRLSIVLLASGMLGLGSGCGLVYLLQVMDDRFRSPEEVRMLLQAPVLAMVRNMEPTEEKGIAAFRVYSHPNCEEVEAYRTLRTALESSTENSQRVVVTSSEPGDGKTTSAGNLALAFAAAGKRTIIIDADMRRPGLSTALELRGQAGLSTVLRDEGDLEPCIQANIQRQVAERLDVLPAGPKPANPAELLAGHRFSELVAWATSQYDQVLIDAPPILAVADAAIAAQFADGVVLVIRPDKNHRRKVVRAVENLTSLGCQLLGTVLNNLNPEVDGSYGYGYGYGYGYEEHEDENTAGAAMQSAATVVNEDAPELRPLTIGTTLDEYEAFQGYEEFNEHDRHAA